MKGMVKLLLTMLEDILILESSSLLATRSCLFPYPFLHITLLRLKDFILAYKLPVQFHAVALFGQNKKRDIRATEVVVFMEIWLRMVGKSNLALGNVTH